MIRVKIDLWPLGLETASEEIGTVDIINREIYVGGTADYDVITSTGIEAEILGFERDELDAWDLVAAALDAVANA